MSERPVLIDDEAGYRFKPHELPILPGSPANPDHPRRRRIAYLGIGIFMGLLGGAQNGFLLANAGALQAQLALTPAEAGWLTVAFYSTYATMSMMLFRVRQEFGIQMFVRWAMVGLVAANFVQMIQPGYYPELAARAVAGITASGLSALAIYYLMQGLPAAVRVGGLVISLGLTQVAFPLTRALSPALLVDGDMSRVFQFQFALSLLGLGLVTLLRLPRLHVLDDGLLASVACNGKGVAWNTAIGQVLADALDGVPLDTLALPPARPVHAIPLHGLKQAIAATGAAWLRLRDRLDLARSAPTAQ